MPSKQAKQTSKGLVFGAVVVRCYAKVRCCAVWVPCGAGAVRVQGAKQRLGAVLVQGCGLISKQGLGAGFLCCVVVLNG
ncbi:hypothetical protein [Thermocrinis sp.]|uniref:hypothetical protein n=1 Tax=Thermocrinis sp. TaxID=2024383 RepID=UPI003BFCF2B8